MPEVAMPEKVQVFQGCCGSVTSGALDEPDAVELAAALKVLAEPGAPAPVVAGRLGSDG